MIPSIKKQLLQTLAGTQQPEKQKGQRRMKVSFDAQLLLEAQKTGIGWMADRLLREMRRIDPKMDLQLNYFQLRDYKNGTPEAMKEYLDLGFVSVFLLLREGLGYFFLL